MVARWVMKLSILFKGCLLVALFSIGAAQATTRTVLNLNDSGAGSLRDTIAASIAGDTVIFTAGLSGNIVLTNGELVIARDLTVIGPGLAALTLQGKNARILRINSTTANISGLSL